MAAVTSFSSSATTVAFSRNPGGGGFAVPSGVYSAISLGAGATGAAGAAGAGFQSRSCSIFPIPITFPPPVGASYRRACPRRRTSAAFNFSRSKYTALGQLSSRTRRKSSGLKETAAASAKDFFDSPQPPVAGSADATAEIQDRHEDPSASSSSSADGDGAAPVHSDPLDQDRTARDHDDDLRDLSHSSPGALRAEDNQNVRNDKDTHQRTDDHDAVDGVHGKSAELDVGNDEFPQHQQLEHEDLSHHVEEDEANSSSQQDVGKDYSGPLQGISNSGAAGIDGVRDGKGKRQQQQQKGGGGIPNSFFRGLQTRTSELDLGDEFDQKELEVQKGLLAAQELSPLDVVVFEAEDEFSDEEAVPMGKFWVESDVQELLSLTGGGSIDLMKAEEHVLKAEQQLQRVMATKDEESSAAIRGELLQHARKAASTNKKIFFHPDPAVAAGELEILLNRSLTALADQPTTVFMKGGLNDWRWEPFIVEMNKRTEIPGDWWSCKIRIPKEAYKVDFIFFDGQSTYEDNSGNNFYVQIEGGMTRDQFEFLLVQERARNAQRLVDDKLRKEGLAAEERRLAEQRAAEVADRAEAKRVVGEKMECARRVLKKALRRVDGLWYVEPSEFGGGDRVTLFYNRSSRPLGYSREIWIHAGANNWEDMVSIVGKLSPAKLSGGDWWSIQVIVPEMAYMLNWVFADGPPDAAQHYDNNGHQDFHAIVPKTAPSDRYWAEKEEEIYVNLRKQTLAREDTAQRKVEYRLRMKDALRAKTMQTFYKSQAHIFYISPTEIHAGDEVTIFYNPSNTLLSGKPDVYIRVSFNRWTYPPGYFATTKMTKAENSNHLMAKVKVPKDAYVIDFVFSEKGDGEGGLYDNRNGLDYHVPVSGSTLRQPALNIIHIALEMAPVAKVGGLGDVVTSLSRAIEEQGHSAQVVLPKYDCLEYKYIEELQEVKSYSFGGTRVKVWIGKVEGLTVHFLEPESGIFWVGCIYGRRDDATRFGFFCHAALEYLLQSGQQPDILHCHDWSSAPVTWLFRDVYKRDNLANARVIFTIHNHEFGPAHIGRAMANAHMSTTVSPTYAREISTNQAIAPHRHKLYGILNGIDPDIWDPSLDPFIPVAYNSENVREGKKSAKEVLQQKLSLRNVDCPVVGIITRLTAQKGINLIKHGIWRTLDRGGQVILLGSAPDARLQAEFVQLASQLNRLHGDMAKMCLYYDEPLSHLIYAAADFMLIPSIFEPCGLTQLTAMRYGAIPIVRQTGGLYDTVFDVDHEQHRARERGVEANGFSFAATDAPGLDYALNRGINAWYEARSWFEELTKRVMEQDWTWNRPALDYIELYNSAQKLP